jgi:TolB-like protein/Tfp pilus assembly protein PilF
VLDFGIAKAGLGGGVQPDLSTCMGKTQNGLILGTAAYMSPEQTRGTAVDKRTDIWAFGCVLYEMLAGRQAFAGETVSDTIAAVLGREPDWNRLPAATPASIRRLLHRCLEKETARRLGAIGDVRVELDDAFAVSTRKVSKKAQVLDSIAVLPFVNAGRDADMDYLCDGITESLINNLSAIPKLRVVPRSTAFRYKGAEIDLERAVRELNVRVLLTGRILERNDTLNVQAELVDAAANCQLWGQKYTRRLTDISTVEEEIAREIVTALRITLNSAEKKRLGRRSTQDSEAYHLYLKGRYFWNKRTAEGFKKAIEYFDQATKKDPNYALALTGLADCYDLMPFYGCLWPKESFPKAKAAAKRAIEIDDRFAEAHASLAYAVMNYDWDWEATERGFYRAIELNPDYATAHHWYSDYLSAAGRHEDAIAQAKRAQQLEPLSLIVNATLGNRFYYARQYERAIDQLQKTLEMDSRFGAALFWIGQAYLQAGLYEEALRAFEESGIQKGLGLAYALSGRKHEAEKIARKLEQQLTERYVSPLDIAKTYIGLGQHDQVFAWLQKAYDERDVWLYFLNVDPELDPLRKDQRFQDLVHRVGLSP